MRGICLTVVAVALLLGSCVKRPDKVLSDEDMAPIIADMELAEAYAQANPGVISDQEKREQLIDGVLKKHGVSREVFDSTMSWYARNSDEYYELYERVDKQLAKRRKNFTGVSTSDDSAGEIWPYSRHALIAAESGERALSFSIPAEQLDKGSRLVWKLRLRSMPSNGFVTFGVNYSDGTASFISRQASSTRKLEFTLQTDTARSVSSIFGNFSLASDADLPLWIDSISLRPLPFDSLEYYNINSQRRYFKPSRFKPKKAAENPDSISPQVRSVVDLSNTSDNPPVQEVGRPHRKNGQSIKLKQGMKRMADSPKSMK